MLNSASSIGCSCDHAERVDQDRVSYPNMLKRFSEWFGLKTKLHESQQTPPLVSEREIWWASVGECRIGVQWQERAVLAAGDHLQVALAWILFRHPDNDAEERGELVRSRPISADRHDRAGNTANSAKSEIWLTTQSRANRSPGRIPCYQGICREFFRF
jgi:hypothetical protein